MKRIFDILVSILGLLILSPILIFIAVLVKLSSKGSVLYRAKRVGQYGKPFVLYKFRSMVNEADKMGTAVTTAHDARITPIGRFLRHYKLDELPQLLNVLKGEMSLVGPRPEDPRYVALYSSEQRKVLDIRPGITSAASIQYRDEESLLTGQDWETFYIQKIMPEKLAIDLEYARRASLLLDFKLILQTLQRIVWK